ncbi:uncharacterized protein LOC122251848 [Penaeus japonicus]|uniref:uncharacterized protein LOC122251848 n=1 Tax=Penaeus japonicus TaxID=27405 RepID=UPI001C70B892|nr:uncharacterized protein LOC122251848 [Penaeus japonicus]
MFGLCVKSAAILLAAVVLPLARVSEAESDEDFLDTLKLDDDDDGYHDNNSDIRDFLTPFKTRDSEEAQRLPLSSTPSLFFGRRSPGSSRASSSSSMASPPRPSTTEDDPFPALFRTSAPEREMPYRFSYGVHDRDTQFGHREESDGNRVSGQYHVLLPGGVRQVVSYYADETGYHPTITYLPALDADPKTSLSKPSPPASPSGSFGARLVAGREEGAGDSSEVIVVGSADASYSRYFIKSDESDEVESPKSGHGFDVRSPSRRASAFARGRVKSLGLFRRGSRGQSSSSSVAGGVPLAQAATTGRRRTPPASNFVRRFEVVPIGSLSRQSYT